jgi:hypothetical protein
LIHLILPRRIPETHPEPHLPARLASPASLIGLGRVEMLETNFGQAASLFDQAQKQLKEIPNPPDRLVVSVFFNIGSFKMSSGQKELAKADFDRCLLLLKPSPSPDNPPLVDEFDSIANYCLQEGRNQNTLRIGI